MGREIQWKIHHAGTGAIMHSAPVIRCRWFNYSDARGDAISYLNRKGLSLAWCNLRGANIGSVAIDSIGFEFANLKWSEVQSKEIDNCSFEGANLMRCRFFARTIRRSNFTLANFSFAETCGHFIDCDFSLAYLYCADFSGCTFKNCDFTNAHIEGADFTNAKFERTHVEFDKWKDAAKWDGSTGIELNEACKGRAINHKKKDNKSTDEGFYNSWEWKKARYAAIIMHGRRCMCCGWSPTSGGDGHLVVDHIKALKLRPDLALDVSNLQILCNDCNMGKAQRSDDFRQ